MSTEGGGSECSVCIRHATCPVIRMRERSAGKKRYMSETNQKWKEGKRTIRFLAKWEVYYSTKSTVQNADLQAGEDLNADLCVDKKSGREERRRYKAKMESSSRVMSGCKAMSSPSALSDGTECQRNMWPLLLLISETSISVRAQI